MHGATEFNLEGPAKLFSKRTMIPINNLKVMDLSITDENCR